MFKVAILGCENSHANSFLKYVIKEKKYDDIEFVGVYSDDADAVKKLESEFGVKGVDSYDAFVGKIDGLIITARHGDNHYQYAKPYIDSGIPMFIDKPITCSEKEADEFMNLLAKNNVRITGGSSCVHCDLIQELQAGVKDGKYGKISGGHYQPTAEGTLIDLFRADWMLRGAIIPQGEGTLIMRFEPESYQIGENISRASSIILILLLLASTAGAALLNRKK
jgi:predicted dehydrogenase